MRALVVLAHPRPDSYGHAVCGAAVRGLLAAGHDVEVVDLHADGFCPVMSAQERRAYHSGAPILDPLVQRYADAVGRAEALVFVYPTWWSGLPAVLKGWLEKVMVEGVAFRFDAEHRVRPALGHLRRVVGISTYGSSRPYVRLVHDNGRRILTRALRLSTGWRTRTDWLAMYAVDTSTPEQRRAFLGHVEDRMRNLGRRRRVRR